MSNPIEMLFPNISNKETLEQRLELLKLSGINEIFVESNTTANNNEMLLNLALKYRNCEKCRLSESRHNFVFGEGSPYADIMFIGEGPGEQEDLQARPFVGAAGQLLNKMLKAISFHREDVYITNIVKCRPPKNRDPEFDEISACIPLLYKQIEIIQPKIICALGRIAGNTLLDTTKSLSSMRARFCDFQNYKIMVTYHPSALLYRNEWKKPTWEDLKMLMRECKKLDIFGNK